MTLDTKEIVERHNAALTDAQRNPESIEVTLKRCTTDIRRLSNILRTPGTSASRKSHLLATVGIIKSIRSKLKALQISGGSLRPAHPNRENYVSSRVKWEDLRSAFNNRIRTGCIINLKHKDPLEFLEDCGTLFVRRITNTLKKEAFLKVNTAFCGKFGRTANGEEIEEHKYLNTKNKVISRDTNIAEWFAENVLNKITKELGDFQERDSGWALKEVINLTIHINKYTPQLGSSYIELPPQIARKEACINVKNNDDACFAWAILAALHPVGHGEHPDRTSSYRHHFNTLNLDGIQFPVNRPDTDKFEKQNDISVNVYVLQKDKEEYTVSPSRLTKNKRESHVNLLLIQNHYNEQSAEPIRYHYVCIKNLSRLVSSQLSVHHRRKLFCDRCLHYFYSEEKLQQHAEDCQRLNDYKVVFPPKKNIKFENYKNKERAPFIIYADFECLLKPMCRKSANTEQYQEHEAHSAGYYIKCSYDDSFSYYKSFRGPKCAEWFARELQNISTNVESILHNPQSMDPLTPQQSREFNAARVCHICGRNFTTTDVKVRDHCHLTGKYRGPAHQGCNLNYKDARTIPVVFHNLSNYDMHLIIRDISNSIAGHLRIIPNNTEKYISAVKYVEGCDVRFKFIDSFRFMASSLEKLSSYLDEKKIVRSEFKDISEEKFQLLTRKGVFPYEHIKEWRNLEETQLPPMTCFYSSLSESGISAADYQHAQDVWQEFNIKNLGEYSDLYLKTDVLLLADIFENFRDCSIDNFGLDPAHYYTAPGLSWDCMLKTTGVELELIHNVDMLMFIEKGIRGGITQCSKRHAKANNKYMADYDQQKPTKYLMYYDVNAMYSWAMMQFLPYGNLQWVEDVDSLDFNISDDSPVGYILEVDLEYPEEIHDRQQDLPMAPVKEKPPTSKNEKKMLATLKKKEKYVIHYRNLKQYIAGGLKVTKIHRVLKFSQSAWMKPYIELCAELRKSAKNEFEKSYFKLKCNAVFGKTMENVRLRRDIKLVTAWEGRYGAEALISKPNFHCRTIFDDHLVAIELRRNEVLFNKPIYVGMAILDISKTVLYEFHYNFMKNRYGENCELCYTDTDSLIYQIQTDDVYEDMKQHLHRFDTSDYPPNNQFNIPLMNKKIPGLMKDENNGAIMLEFVGLRAKMYATKVQGEKITKKAKGVKSYVVNNKITFEDYLTSLKDNLEHVHVQNSIRSQQHILYSTAQKKLSLSPHDNKRYLIPGSTSTLPWGHYSIMDID